MPGARDGAVVFKHPDLEIVARARGFVLDQVQYDVVEGRLRFAVERCDVPLLITRLGGDAAQALRALHQRCMLAWSGGGRVGATWGAPTDEDERLICAFAGAVEGEIQCLREDLEATLKIAFESRAQGAWHRTYTRRNYRVRVSYTPDPKGRPVDSGERGWEALRSYADGDRSYGWFTLTLERRDETRVANPWESLGGAVGPLLAVTERDLRRHARTQLTSVANKPFSPGLGSGRRKAPAAPASEEYRRPMSHPQFGHLMAHALRAQTWVRVDADGLTLTRGELCLICDPANGGFMIRLSPYWGGSGTRTLVHFGWQLPSDIDARWGEAARALGGEGFVALETPTHSELPAHLSEALRAVRVAQSVEETKQPWAGAVLFA